MGVRPANVTVFQGEQAMFNCSGSSVTWLRKEWYREDSSSHLRLVLVVKFFESPDTWYRQNRQNKFAVTGRYNLIVSDVDARSDSGTYSCNTNEDNTLLRANLVVIGNIPRDFSCTLHAHHLGIAQTLCIQALF